MIPLSLALLIAAPVPADPPFPEDVQVLLRKLGEPAAEPRLEAIQQLRLLARRADISGGQRIRRGEEFAPKVKGLVPYLIRAAGDEADPVRLGSLAAMQEAGVCRLDGGRVVPAWRLGLSHSCGG